MRQVENIECPVCGTEYDAEREEMPGTMLDESVSEYIDPPICPYCGLLYKPDETLFDDALYLRVGELWEEVQRLKKRIQFLEVKRRRFWA